MKYQSIISWVLIAVATIILLVASTYKLSEAPAVWFDEGMYTQAAMNLAEHGVQELQIAPGTFTSSSYLTVGYPLLFPVSVSYRLFGVGVWQGRMVMVFFIIACAAAAYALVCMLFGRLPAAWALLLLTTFPILYGDGKPVLGEVPGMLFLLLTFIALLWLERSHYTNARGYGAAGFAAGLCVVTKPIFILLLPALAAVWFIRRRTTQVHWRGFLLAVGVFVLPVLVWAYIQFGGDASFAKQLEYYIASPYPTTNELARALKNFLQFFTQTTPIYTALTMVAWSVSLLFRKKRGEIVASVELAMLTFCFFILAAYLRIEGWYRYFFPAELLALLFLPNALTEIFRYAGGKIVFFKNVFWLPYVIMSLLVAVHLYQLVHSSYVAQYYSSTNTADLYTAFGSLGAQSSFFLANVPEVAIFLPSRNYYQYIDAAPDLRIGADQMPALQSGVPQYVILLPSTYEGNPELFTHYVLKSKVGKYEVLAKRQ